MADQVTFEGKPFFNKIQKIVKTWNQIGDSKDALVFLLGKTVQGTERPLTSDFFMWLLNYELPETVLLITKQRIVFAVSAKKKTMLESMELPENYDGPQLEILVRDIKQDNTQEVIDTLISYIPSGGSREVGLFLKDKVDGDLTSKFLHSLDSKGFRQTDLKELLDRSNLVKIDAEIYNLGVATKFLQWTFENVVKEIEDIIEVEKKVKHEQISKKAEGMLEDEKKLRTFLKKNPNLKTEFLEYPLGILIQSGNQFVLNKLNVQSDDKPLNFETIYINVIGKYKDMNVMASRTLLVNPQDDQKRAYLIAYEAIEVLSKNLQVGQPIKNAYISVRDFISSKDKNLASKLHTNLGFGIGCNIKEDLMMINETNETLVQPNMSFHVRITLTDVNKKPTRSIVALGETILIDSQGVPQILTVDIQRRYKEISYSLDDEEDEKMKDVTTNKSNGESSRPQNGNGHSADREHRRDDMLQRATKTDLIQQTRLRQKNAQQHNNEEQRKKSQEELLDKKLEELKRRYENGEIVQTSKKEKVKKMGQIQAYQTDKSFPKDIKPGQLFVDMKNDCILVPVNQNSFVPFHVATIKNVSINQEGQWTFLRLNFHIPGGSTLQFPPMNDPQSLFVKELTLKNLSKGGENHLNHAFKQIKDLIKKVKNQEIQDENAKQEEKLDHIEELITVKGKKETLDGLVIRPNIVGKKTVGTLEIHQNGVRFASQKGHNVDIPFSNIKHAFFQPCADDELIVIIHFHLKIPIMVNNKKLQDVQFFKEAGNAADDLDVRGNKRRLNDMDELEQEERERQLKEKLNMQFNQFVKIIEQVSERNPRGTPIEFDIPFEELDFFGCPNKSVVKVRPTKNCLIAISEFPFFVIDISEIEHVHFERVQFGIKNFDMAIIFRDFTTFKRINSIPIEHIEDIKSYLDEIGIIYSESIVPMNWANVLQQIREDFEAFLDEGGWKFLQDSGEGSDDEGEEDEDGEFSVESEEDFDESSASDFSDEDDDDDNSSDFDDEDELSEEGLSWEEMEKQAEEEDRRAAARRQGRDVPQVPTKRRPGGRR